MATPRSDGTDQSSKVDSPQKEDAGAPATKPGAAAPARRARGFVSKLFFTILTVLVLLGIAGYGALIFRDVDPNVGVAANYVEQGLTEAQGLLDKAQETVADLTGAPKPASKAASRRALLDKAPLAPTTPAAPAPAPVEAAPEPAAVPAPAPVETAKEPEKPAPAAPPAAETRAEPVPEPPQKPVELAQEPTPAPVPAPAPVAAGPAKPAEATAARVETPDADGFTDRDLISALEGRIDALSDEVRALREKLEAPKSEMRAEPQTEAPKASPAVADTAAAHVALAYALQRRVESGRPFAEEIAAIARLGADPAPAPILIETSEKGVAPPAQLRESFAAAARKLKSHESHGEAGHEGGNLTEHLLEGASKLVKVRPVGHAHPDSLEGKMEKVEAALSHDDFAAAEAAFEALPEEARNEAKDFGDALRQRNEAVKAADEFLHAAVAALGAKK